MTDSWCSAIYNGERTLHGAAAREYRLRLAGGVDAVTQRVAAKAARDVLNEINSLADAVVAPKSKVVLLRKKRTIRPQKVA